MAVGLQIFDASGNIVLDATYRVMRIVSAAIIAGGSGLSGTLSTDSRLAQGCWVSFQPAQTAGDGYLNRGVVSPRFTYSGGALTYSYATGNNGAMDTYQGGTVFWGSY